MEEKKTETPVEEKSYSLLYFVFASILLFVTIWAIWDETVTRRPWKSYQKQFYKIQAEKVKAEYEEAAQNIQSDLENLKTQLEAAKEDFNTPQNQQNYKRAKQKLDKYQTELDEVNEEYQFIKSEFGEINYLYEKALKNGNQVEAENKKAQMDKLGEKMNELLSMIEAITLNRDKAKEAVKQFMAKIDALQDEISTLTADMNRLQRKIETTEKKLPEIKQIVIDGFDKGNFANRLDRVDRCTTCHMGVNDPSFVLEEQPFTYHPQLLSNHPESKFGCTTCHGGQGRALTVKAAHGNVRHWEYPLMKDDFVQSSCRECHDNVINLQGAPLLSRGKRLFMDFGCSGCHEVEGYENLQKVGVSLNRLSHKVNVNWLQKWLKNPKEYLPKAKMPNFLLEDSEVESIAAYLMNISSKEDFNLQVRYQGRGSSLWSASVSADALENGKKLVSQVGCLGCHVVSDKGHPFAPELNKIGDKVNEDWLLDWLKNPTHYVPEAKMPNFRLSDKEAFDVVAYLMTLKGQEGRGKEGGARGQGGISLDSQQKIKEGEKFVRTYGCFGCHHIKEMEGESKVGVELSDFGSKTVEELDFGRAFDVEESWYGWTVAKLKNSRIFATEQRVLKMPNFSLSSEDAHALAIFLRSLTEEYIPERYVRKLSSSEASVEQGRKVIDKFNCAGCHEIEDKGGDISAIIVQMLQKEGKTEAEAKIFTPPPFDGEGEKVQPDWLFTFLKNPTTIRPWLSVRMPTFSLSDEEATILTKYFSAVSNHQFPYQYVEERKLSGEYQKAARLLFSKEYLDCFKCHQKGSKKPEGRPEEWAPDFALAQKRLKRDWVVKWLENPQKIQPGTKMPDYFFDEYAGPEDILDGDESRQIEVLTDYLMNFD